MFCWVYLSRVFHSLVLCWYFPFIVLLLVSVAIFATCPRHLFREQITSKLNRLTMACTSSELQASYKRVTYKQLKSGFDSCSWCTSVWMVSKQFLETLRLTCFQNVNYWKPFCGWFSKHLSKGLHIQSSYKWVTSELQAKQLPRAFYSKLEW